MEREILGWSFVIFLLVPVLILTIYMAFKAIQSLREDL